MGANFRLQMNGLDELRAQLRALPGELTAEAEDIVISNAEGCAREIEAGYPQGPTGNLKARVTVIKQRSSVATAAVVKSRAPHANIFERGTFNRQTDRGWNRGRMPKPPVDQQMVPKAIKWRARMMEQLKELVRRAGFEVAA